MFDTTHKTLRTLAALVWYTGFIVLAVKSSGLFFLAAEVGINFFVIIAAVFCGIFIGKIKAKKLFYGVGKKNIERINELIHPKIWQFYRKRFFFFLFLMISMGNYLAVAAQGNGPGLLFLGTLELSIGTALLLSSNCFWSRR